MQSLNTKNNTMLLSHRIAEQTLSLRYEDVPEGIWDYLKKCILDAIGIAFASRTYSFADKALASIELLGSKGAATIIGQSRTVSARDAAMINGLLIHGLDFDDTHLASVVHCSASAFSAALALAEQKEESGKNLLFATLMAIEIDAVLGRQAGGVFQRLGFHPTGVVGIFGATVAAAYLLNGDENALVRAQGIALSMCSGSMAFLDDGSWTKRLHPGWAASAALHAASLGVSGFEGPNDAYGGRFGFYSLYAPGTAIDLRAISEALFSDWQLLKVAIKPYPICHFNHSLIDSALAIKKKSSFDIEDIDRVTILLHEGQFGVVVDPIEEKRKPKNEYDAKFSAPYAVATALLKGHFGLPDLKDEARLDPKIASLLERIDCEHEPRSEYPQKFSGGVRVQLKDGSSIEHFELVNQGAEGQLLSDIQVREKFMNNCVLSIPTEHAEAIWNCVTRLEDLSSTRVLTMLLQG